MTEYSSTPPTVERDVTELPRDRADRLREGAARFGPTHFSGLEPEMKAFAKVMEELR
ncbi:hypothetical protein ACFV9W_01210 [Streptomyces sp. NPDC059897]|uniref:hypothetical protein n=1 Tax=Streptomyces sp. NPDC059897 TaxID=3346994 RepID=UPI00365BD08F